MGADGLKSSSSAPTRGTRSASTQSPQPPSTSLPSSASVPGASPPSVSGKIRSSKFTQEQRPYPTNRQPPVSKSPSSSGEEIQQQLVTLTETVVQQQTTPVVRPSNRFAVLMDEVTDLDDLAETVIDPLVSPSPKAHPVASSITLSESAAATPVCNSPPAQVSSESEYPGESPAEFLLPPQPSRQPLEPSTALVPVGYKFDSHPSSGQAASISEDAACQGVSLMLPLQSSSSASSPLPALRPCDSPDLFALVPWSGHSEGALTTPSFHCASQPSPTLSEDSFYARSLDPTFQEGGSDRDGDFPSDGDFSPFSLPFSPPFSPLFPPFCPFFGGAVGGFSWSG